MQKKNKKQKKNAAADADRIPSEFPLRSRFTASSAARIIFFFNWFFIGSRVLLGQPKKNWVKLGKPRKSRTGTVSTRLNRLEPAFTGFLPSLAWISSLQETKELGKTR